jgi:hypothetical protein
MSPEQLNQVGGDTRLIARLRPRIYGIGIPAALVAITDYRILREI